MEGGKKLSDLSQGGRSGGWGNGTAIHSRTYVGDIVDGIYRLMQSTLDVTVNIGSPQYVAVAELVAIVTEVAHRRINNRYVIGPIGVQSRNFSNERICSIGWRPKYSLFKDGITLTYPWVEAQVQSGETYIQEELILNK